MRVIIDGEVFEARQLTISEDQVVMIINEETTMIKRVSCIIGNIMSDRYAREMLKKNSKKVDNHESKP